MSVMVSCVVEIEERREAKSERASERALILQKVIMAGVIFYVRPFWIHFNIAKAASAM